MKIFISILTILFFFSADGLAQYDNIHYVPPIHSRTNGTSDIGPHYVFLSTNETIPFDVTITESNGNVLAVKNISITNPDSLYLGSGWDAINIVDTGQLNTILNSEGLILTANQPFFTNVRQISGSQGFSLTAKGSFALGTRFRCGHMYSNKAGANNLKSHMISVMATEDNTTIDFSDIKSGVIFHNTPVTSGTSNNISITLNRHESYVIAANMDEPGNTGNDTLLNGVLVTSNRPIVINTGSILGGSDRPLGEVRDAGTDQIVGVEKIGTEYILVKEVGAIPQETEKIVVIADFNNTAIFINGGTTPYTTLNAGEFSIIPHTYYDANNIMYISSSKSVFVYQTTNSHPTNLIGVGLNFIPPISCAGTREVTIGEISFIGTAGMDLVSKKGANISINSGAINLPAAFPVSGNSAWEVYRLDTTALTGTIHVLSDDVMNLSVYTVSGARGAAGYFSGFNNVDKPEVKIESTSGKDTLIEGCEPFRAIFGKGGSNLNVAKTFFINVEGTAINGVDYDLVPDSIVIAAGQDADTLTIGAIDDVLKEGLEEVVFTVTYTGPCGDTLIVSDTLYIRNYFIMESTISEDNNICKELSEVANISVDVKEGIPPYSLLWSPGLFTTSSNVVSPEKTTRYTVSITDACNKTVISDSIIIFAQCPPAAVNIVTPNGDGYNDLLRFPNLEDYENTHMVILNRWGKTLFETDNYQNDWDGADLSDGVYYYILTFNNSVEPLPSFTLEPIKGYFHIMH